MANSGHAATLFVNRLQKNCGSVEVEKLFLTFRKATDVKSARRIDAHALKRWTVSYGRNDERSIVLEANKSPIEEVINAWG